MYSSRGNSSYGQQQQQPKPQSYSGQSAYSQNLGADAASQMPIASRHSTLLGGHPPAGTHYGGQYTSVYGSTALNSALQVPPTSSKGAGPSILEGRSGYGSTMQDSPKFTSGDYPAATQKYGQKGEKMLTDYPSGDRDRLPYTERASAYSGRDLQNESSVRFADSIAFGHQHQPDIYDRLDAASALRQELLHAQSLQSASVDGSSRFIHPIWWTLRGIICPWINGILGFLFPQNVLR